MAKRFALPDRLPDPQYTMDDYWVALYKRKWIIIIVMAVAAVVAAYVSKAITPRYEASTVFYVPQDVSAPLGAQSPVGARLPSGLQDHAKALAAVLKHPDAWEVVQQRFPEKPLNRFGKDIDIVVPREGVIRVYVRDTDPELAANIANAMVEYFDEFHQNIIGGDLDRALSKIAGEVEEIDAKIQAAISAKEQFELEHQIASLATRRGELEQERIRFGDLLQQARVDRDTVQQRIASVQEQLDLESAGYRDGDILIDNRLISSLQETISDLEVQLAGLRADLTPDHPDVLSIQKRYDRAKENLQREIARVVESQSKLEGTLYADLRRQLIGLYVDRSAVEMRIAGFDSSLQAVEENIRKIPGLLTEADRYDDEIRRFRSTKAILEGSRDDLTTRSLQRRETALVIDRAEVPGTPVFPILPLNAGIAALFGLIAGVMYALLLEHFEIRRRMRALHNLELEQWMNGSTTPEPARTS